MAYEAALKRAWDELSATGAAKPLRVKLFGKEYTAYPKEKQFLATSQNIPADEYTTVLVLHYLLRKSAGLLALTGRWVSFKELEGGAFYYPAYQKRAEEPLLRKCGQSPDRLKEAAARLGARPSGQGDLSYEIETFPEVPVLVILWRGTDEFPAEIRMLFDSSIKDIFTTEEVAVLGGLVASNLKIFM